MQRIACTVTVARFAFGNINISPTDAFFLDISLEHVTNTGVYEGITVKGGFPGTCGTKGLLNITVFLILEHYT
jgi:hypothetical protein